MSPPQEHQDGALPVGPPSLSRDITFLQDSTTDHLLRAIVTLTMELSVTRDRLRSVEMLLSRDGRDLAAEIDGLAPTSAELATRKAERERLIKAILQPLLNPEG